MAGKRHFLTEHNNYSYCEATDTHDVHSYGDDKGPTTYCEACREGEPEWEHIEESDYFQLAQ